MADEQDSEILRAELLARVDDAPGPYDEAVWRLMSGEPDAGLEALRRSLADLLPGTPANAHLAKLALLVDDPRAPDVAAAAVDDTLARFVPGSREYHAAMLAVMAGDLEQARRLQAALDRYVATHDKLRGGEPSRIGDILAGLLDADADRLAAGVESLLAFHLRRARARSDLFNSSHGVISLDAIVALILGHRDGLVVPVQRTYRAAQVPLLVLHLKEWEGRPLPTAVPISVVTDLVAGPWLRRHGVTIEDAPVPFARSTQTKRPARTAAASTPAEQATALRALEVRMRLGGHPWQLASWALILGDRAAARGHLEAAAAEAYGRWQASTPQAGGLSRWFSKDQALPNQNFVREHFALALVLGESAGQREAVRSLQAWLKTQEGQPSPIYAHADGYLDVICDLTGGGERSTPSREVVEHAMGPLPSTRVAVIGLAERNGTLLREGLESMLTEHAKTLEHKSSPPPPICVPAVHVAVAARRLGVPATVDERFGAWPVPVEGARFACDLLGRALWSAST